MTMALVGQLFLWGRARPWYQGEQCCSERLGPALAEELLRAVFVLRLHYLITARLIDCGSLGLERPLEAAATPEQDK